MDGGIFACSWGFCWWGGGFEGGGGEVEGSFGEGEGEGGGVGWVCGRDGGVVEGGEGVVDVCICEDIRIC